MKARGGELAAFFLVGATFFFSRLLFNAPVRKIAC
jgi:hypothetical protein